MSVTVLGGGTWGTALTILLANKGVQVVLWSRHESRIAGLSADRRTIDNLPGAVLPESVILTTDTEYACRTSEPEVIIFAVASPYVRETAALVRPYITEGQRIVNVAKGIEETTLYTLRDIILDELPMADVSVLSGPSHAEEVSRLIPTTVVVASSDKDTAEFLQDLFMTEHFRVYTSSDIIGVELGGSIKNVIALAAGISDGLGFGDNTKAALMTRGLAEISRLGIAMGASAETLAGLSGVGDLFVTCTSQHSRNRRAGFLIGSGMTAQAAMTEVNQVVEGVHCARAALKLAEKYHVEMPIVEQVNHILFDGKSPRTAVSELLTRDKRPEHNSLEW